MKLPAAFLESYDARRKLGWALVSLSNYAFADGFFALLRKGDVLITMNERGEVRACKTSLAVNVPPVPVFTPLPLSTAP